MCMQHQEWISLQDYSKYIPVEVLNGCWHVTWLMNLVTLIDPGVLAATAAVCQDEVDKCVNFELANVYLVRRLVFPSVIISMLSSKSSWMSKRICVSGRQTTRQMESTKALQWLTRKLPRRWKGCFLLSSLQTLKPWSHSSFGRFEFCNCCRGCYWNGIYNGHTTQGDYGSVTTVTPMKTPAELVLAAEVAALKLKSILKGDRGH